jgi:microcystin-dependent protein
MPGPRYWPVVLNGVEYTETDFDGTNYVTGLPAALHDMVLHAASLWTATSATAVTIGSGAKSFSTQPGKPWLPGSPMRISSAQNPVTHWMDAVVTSYNADTGALSVFVVGSAGSGSLSSWNINAGGGGYAIEGVLPLSQGGTGSPDAQSALNNLGAASRSIALTAGLGLVGGGDLSSSRVFDFFPGEFSLHASSPTADFFLLADPAGNPRRQKISEVLSLTGQANIAALGLISTPNLQNDFFAIATAAGASGRAPLSALNRLVPAGVIAGWAGVSEPQGWIYCDGRSLLRSAEPALFAAIGTTYGAPSATTFAVPDYRGRVMVGRDNMTAAAGRLGAVIAGGQLGAFAGQEWFSMSVSQLAQHGHPMGGNFNVQGASGGSTSIPRVSASAEFGGGEGFMYTGGIQNNPWPITVGGGGGSVALSGNVGATGSQAPISLMQPSMICNIIIKL